MNIKSIRVDIAAIRWGTPPAPLMPGPLRALWGEERLPEWVCSELGLGSKAAISDLGPQVWATAHTCSLRLRNFLLYLLRTRGPLISQVKCVGQPWPVGLKPDDVAWSARTRNCLVESGLFNRPELLSEITYGELFKIPHLGVTSALDFAATLEGAITATPTEKTQILGNQGDNDDSLRHRLIEYMTQNWSQQVSAADPRFADVLPTSDKTLQEQIDDLLTRGDAVADIPAIEVLADAALSVKSRIRNLESMFIEDELIELLAILTKSKGERLHVLADRFGWSGNRPITIEDAGRRLGVTRERIRQIQANTEKKLPEHEICMPGVDKALQLLNARAPIQCDEASAVLQAAKITRNRFDIETLLEIARGLNKEVPLEVIKSGKVQLVTRPDSGASVQAVNRVARNLAGKSGVASIYQVFDTLAAKTLRVEESDLRQVLHVCRNLQFLNDDWFYATDIKDSRNRLYNTAAKILSVAPRQTIRSVREGVKRLYKWRTTSNPRNFDLVLPPIEVMKRFFEVHPAFRVDGDEVEAAITFDYVNELGQTERVMYEVLRESPGGVLDRASFARSCLRRGMNENTFTIYSSYSPIIEHSTVGVWMLRGTHPTAAATEAVRIAAGVRPREKRVLEYGWNESGQLWIAIRVPFVGKNSLVVGIPGPVKRFISGGEYQVFAKNTNQPCGNVVVQADGTSYGYGPFIRRNGVDQDDILMAEFNMAKKTVFLSVPLEEALES